METLTLTINNKEVRVRKGDSVLEAAQNAGIYIPALCADAELEPTGGCRLCVVEIEGINGYPPSCQTPAADRMVVRTNTPQLQEMRRNVLQLVFREHPRPCIECWRRKRCGPDDICLRNVEVTDRCVVCPKNNNCELQKAADYVGLKEMTLPYTYRGQPLIKDNPFYVRDLNKCVHCAMCARVCREIRGVQAVDVSGCEFGGVLDTCGHKPVVDYSLCISCGACVSKCPVGALFVRDEERADTQVRTICTYCGVGCGVLLGVRGGKIVSVLPDKENQVNRGYLCVKGHFGLKEMVHHSDRLTSPLIREGSGFRKVTWDEALDLVASRFSAYASDQHAVISSARCTNEDNYVTQKFARVVLGTNNVDHCARL